MEKYKTYKIKNNKQKRCELCTGMKFSFNLKVKQYFVNKYYSVFIDVEFLLTLSSKKFEEFFGWRWEKRSFSKGEKKWMIL